jgi:hypothetical protein
MTFREFGFTIIFIWVVVIILSYFMLLILDADSSVRDWSQKSFDIQLLSNWIPDSLLARIQVVQISWILCLFYF